MIFQLYEGVKWNQIQNFKNNLSQKVDIYKYFETNSFIRVYAWNIIPQFRGQGKCICFIEIYNIY